MLPRTLTPELGEAVEGAYRVFGDYTLRKSLTVCHCDVCMTFDTERALVETPLRNISSALLAEYTNSAHGWDDGSVAHELRYFLPRYFELIAANDPPDAIGLAICLRRLANAGWREAWPSAEVDAIDRFFDALLLSSLERVEIVRWPIGWRLQFDLTDILTLVITANGDLDRALATWYAASDPAAAIHMAALRMEFDNQSGQWMLRTPFLKKNQTAAAKIAAFLMDPVVSTRIENAFFAVNDECLQQILSDGQVSVS